MLYREIIAVCSESHTKHINTLCGQNVEFVSVKLAVHQGCITPQTVKHHASQSQERNNKYFILYIEFCFNNKI